MNDLRTSKQSFHRSGSRNFFQLLGHRREIVALFFLATEEKNFNRYWKILITIHGHGALRCVTLGRQKIFTNYYLFEIFKPSRNIFSSDTATISYLVDLINILLIIYLRVNVCREGPYQFVFQYGYGLQARAKRFFEILVEDLSYRLPRTFTATIASFRCENSTFAQPLLRLQRSLVINERRWYV